MLLDETGAPPPCASRTSALAHRGVEQTRCGEPMAAIEHQPTWRTQAASRLRPLLRRAERIARPARVRMRRRKPCVLARRRLFGWYVRLLTSVLRWVAGIRSLRATGRVPAPTRERAAPATRSASVRYADGLRDGQTDRRPPPGRPTLPRDPGPSWGLVRDERQRMWGLLETCGELLARGAPVLVASQSSPGLLRPFPLRPRMLARRARCSGRSLPDPAPNAQPVDKGVELALQGGRSTAWNMAGWNVAPTLTARRSRPGGPPGP